MVTYSPALDAAELAAAARALRAASLNARARAAHAPHSRETILATGFAGPAADAAAVRLTAYGDALDASAAQLAAAAGLLESASQAQAALDAAAFAAGKFAHRRLVMWLNAMSMLLDVKLAQALRLLGGREQDYDPLFANPGEDLHSLHARHAATVPAATLAEVEAAGGVILEAGPASTTVMVGASFEDLIAPERVITMVAGATTGKPEQLAHELEKARGISAHTGAPVVVWQGYVPPRRVSTAISPAPANAGADDLSMFQAALEERFPDAQKTVVAHSYGTLLATKAAAEHGLLADDLWLLGSPGVAGAHASDLSLAGEHSTVHVVDAHLDPILLLRHGPHAAVGTSPSHESWGADEHIWVRGHHSDHFTDPAFLSALTQRADHPAKT